MILDIHGDIWTDVTVKRLNGETNIIKKYHLDRFKKGNMVGGIFVVWADPPNDTRPKERLKESVIAIGSELRESRDFLSVIYSSKDFWAAIEEDKLAVILGLEGLSGIGTDIDLLDSLYQFGFRHASLTWNEENELATGVKGNPNRGLTEIGKKAVKRINELGMIIDVSHANEKSFWDIVDTSESPIIASHSNSKSICNVPRNLDDKQIRAIGNSGGLIGLNAFNEFIHKEHDKRTVDTFIDHIVHMASLIGIDKLALGFDFFEYISNTTSGSFTEDEYKGTLGLEDISKTNTLVTRLSERNFSKSDIDKLTHLNFLSLMDTVLK